MKLENSMIGDSLAWRAPQPPRRARLASRILCLGAIVVSVTGSSATADEQTGRFATACALQETKVVILIEEHGDAEDLPSDRLSDAGLAMLRARQACYEGRVGEALALYDGILSLGPVVLQA
jgi:hypothetical protein